MKIEGKEYRTIWYQGNVVKIIDQTKLPHQFIIKDLKSVKDAINAIKVMEVRGAPLIGGTAAYGIVLAIMEKNDPNFIEKRVNEIENILDQLLDSGIKPKNIFLSGVSAGGWSSLMLMPKVGIKFNSAIIFAPACCGPRHEINKYPVWRKEIRPKQVKQIKEADLIKALIFAYEDDKFNRSKELMFLKEKSPDTVNIIAYKCGEGHNTYRKDCRINETKKILKKYIEEQG